MCADDADKLQHELDELLKRKKSLEQRLFESIKEDHRRAAQQKCQKYKYKVKWNVELYGKSHIEPINSEDYKYLKISCNGIPYLDCYEREGCDYILLFDPAEYDDMNVLIRRINAVADLNIPEYRDEAIRIILGKDDDTKCDDIRKQKDD
jgi:hypothetical protein